MSAKPFYLGFVFLIRPLAADAGDAGSGLWRAFLFRYGAGESGR